MIKASIALLLSTGALACSGCSDNDSMAGDTYASHFSNAYTWHHAGSTGASIDNDLWKLPASTTNQFHTYFAEKPTPKVLEVGDTLELNWSFSLSDMQDRPSGFRIAILDSGWHHVTSSLEEPSHPLFTFYKGYALSIDLEDGLALSLWKRDKSNQNLLSSLEDAYSKLEEKTEGYNLTEDTIYTANITLQRTENGATRIQASIQAERMNEISIEATDSHLPLNNFDTLAIHTLEGLAESLNIHSLALDAQLTAGQAEIWTEYTENPDQHPTLPNVSYAGYHYGEKEIPWVEGPIYNIRDYGATGDGETNDQPAIRAAIEAVGEEGGVVFFPNGEYKIDGLLFVHTNNTVLRGESREGVKLIFTQPLAKAWGVRQFRTERPWTNEQQQIVENLRQNYGNVVPEGPNRVASPWSWSGGLVWFTPEERATYREDPSAPIQSFGESWLLDGELGKVVEKVTRGSSTITLDQAPDIQPGDFVVLRLEDPGDFSLSKHLTGDGPWAEAYNWSQNNSSGYPNGMRGTPRWVAEVTAIDGTDVTFRQPLRTDIRPEWNPVLSRLGPTIRESGLETMTLVFQRKHIWEGPGHNIYPGWNGPWFNVAINCWMRDITLIDVDNGPGVSAAKCLTMSDFRFEVSRPEMMTHHHGTTCRQHSQDCLFVNFEFQTQPRHGINTEQFSAGNVWSRGYMAHGTFDTHRNLPYDSVRTEVVINNDGHHGGTGGPVQGARFAHWNIEITNDRSYIIAWANLLPKGSIVGLRGTDIRWNERGDLTPVGEISETRVEAHEQYAIPGNLYEAQLRHRLQN